MSMEEITDPLIDAWRGSDIALLEALEGIADNVVAVGSGAFRTAVPDHSVDNWLQSFHWFSDDVAMYGPAVVADAFHTAHKKMFDELLEAGRCPACGGEITEDGCAGDSSVWCSDCGKDWT